MEQALHLKNWTGVAIDILASKLASITPNIAYVETGKTGRSVKCCERSLASLTGRGFGSRGTVGQTFDHSTGHVVDNPQWDYGGKWEPSAPVTVSGGGHSWLTVGEWRSKALSVVKPHEELEPLDADHLLHRLVNNPNPWDTGFAFRYERVMFGKLHGVDYVWEVPNDYGVPVERWVLPGHWVWPRTGGKVPDGGTGRRIREGGRLSSASYDPAQEVGDHVRWGSSYISPWHADAGKLIQYYEVRPWGGMGSAGILRLPPSEVTMRVTKSPLNKIDGYSKLSMIAQWIDEEEAISRSRWSQSMNIARPEFWVELGAGYEDPDDDRTARVEAKLMAKFQGEYNYGKPIIGPPGAKFNPLSFSPTEMAYFQCYSGDTEYLTPKGWQRYTELTGDTEIACYDQASDALVYHKPSRVYVKRYKGPMHRWQGKNVDALITPKHRCWVKGRSGWAVERVGELESGKKYHLRASAPVDCRAPEIIEIPKYRKYAKGGDGYDTPNDTWKFQPNLWAEFLGWYVSEGHLSKDRPRVCVSQKIDSPHTPVIESLLSNLFGFPWPKNRCGGTDNKSCYQWYTTERGVYEHLQEHCGHRAWSKKLPRYVMAWPAHLLKHLFDAAVAGDGVGPRLNGRGGKVWYYRTTSEQLATDMAEVGVRLGLRSHVYDGTSPGHYTVSFSDETDVTLMPKHRSVVHYDGTIWCVTVPTGLLITRRNGKTHISGNSEEQIRDMILSCFHIPKSVAGISTDMTYGSLLATLAQMCAYALNPDLADYGECDTKHLASRWDEKYPSWSSNTSSGWGSSGGTRRVRLWYDDCVPADPAQVNSDIQTDAQCHAITPDEVRALRGRKPYPNGYGSVPWVQGPGGVAPYPLDDDVDMERLADLIKPMTEAATPRGLDAATDAQDQLGGPPESAEDGSLSGQPSSGPEGESEGEEAAGVSADAETPSSRLSDTDLADDAAGIEDPNGKPSKGLPAAAEQYLEDSRWDAWFKACGKERDWEAIKATFPDSPKLRNSWAVLLEKNRLDEHFKSKEGLVQLAKAFLEARTKEQV